MININVDFDESMNDDFGYSCRCSIDIDEEASIYNVIQAFEKALILEGYNKETIYNGCKQYVEDYEFDNKQEMLNEDNKKAEEDYE